MKKYNKPEVNIEIINLEDVICDSPVIQKGGQFSDWNLAQSGTFDDLWK